MNLEKKLFDKNWNLDHRKEIIERLKTTDYDLIVIGGGVTGAGVAREGAMRGLKVALIEKQDFAAGTSSRSSKLAHGGIRYLAHGDMDLVKEATTERNWMLAHIPHLLRPIPFLFVAWEGSSYKMRDIKGATKIYDHLSDKGEEFKNYKQRELLSKEDVLEKEPEIKEEGNNGGVIYYDNNVDDARLTIETLKEAVIRGTDAVSYVEANDYIMEEGRITGVKCKDVETGEKFDIKGTQVVNATGIWTDELLDAYPDDAPKPMIRPTKGVHLVYRREKVKNNMATIIFSIDDDRAFFVLPRGKFTIIGTTDTDYNNDLANPFCNKDDADYLVRSVEHYFPTAELDYEENLLSTYAGIRPLVKEKGKSESEVSRKHVIFFNENGLLTIAGGKLTTWRQMAEDLLQKVDEHDIFPDIERKKGFSKQMFKIGLTEEEWKEKLETYDVELDNDITHHLYQQYGRGAFKILELIEHDERLKERIIPENDFIKGEIIYSLRYELTTHLIDVFCRRTEMSLFINHEKAEEAAQVVANIMGEEYNWNEKQKENEVQTYLDYINECVSFI